MFLGCRTRYQDSDPTYVPGGDIPEQLGQRTREGNTDIPGLTQHGMDTQQKDNWPQLQALPTSSLKINNGRARSHRGVCGRCKQPRNLRCEFVLCCSGSKSRCYEAHAQGTSGAVQINTDGFASCSFMENVEMGTCQAGLLGRLQLLTGRSKRSCRGKCRGGKFRK